MKPISALRSFLLLAGSTLLTASSLHAATPTWDANGNTAAQTDGAGAWDTATELKWWTGSTNVDWTSGNDAVFGWAGAGGAVTLASPTTVGSLTFKYFTGTYTLGTAGQAITLNNGITRIGGVGGTVAINSPLTLAGAQTWTNNNVPGGPINVQAATTLNGNLTIAGDGIINSVATAAVIGGTGNIIKNGTGQFNFSAGGTPPTHTFTGDIVVNGGSIGFQNSGVLTGRNVHLADGYLGGRYGSGFTWSGGLGTGADQIRITGGTSGLSGEGSVGSTFQIGSAGSTLVWGASGEGSATGYFNPTVLLLNGNHRMNANGKGALNNAIDLNGATRTITSTHVPDSANNSGFTVSGAITTGSGTAGLNKTGTGNLILTANNTYNGATTIHGGGTLVGTSTVTIASSGSITLSGAGGRLSGTSALNLTSGGTLRMVSANAENTVDRMNTVDITVTEGGGLWWENAAGANSFAETVGNVTLDSGLLNINLTTNQTAVGTQTLTLGTLTRNGASSTAFSAGGTGPQASGNKNMIVVTGAGTTTAGVIVGPWATTGTAVNAQTDYAIYDSDHVTSAGITASAQSTWSTTTSATSNYTMSALASGTLSATRNINSLRSTNNSVTVTASSADITLTEHTLAAGDVVTFSATTMPAGLTAGTPYYVVATGVETIQVSATSGGGAITPTTTGTAVFASGAVQVSSGNNLGTTGILNGSATTLNILQSGGAGDVTLPTAGAGQLHVNTGSGIIVNNAPVTDNGGALTLVKSGSAGSLANTNITTTGILVLNGVNTYTGDTIINGGTLRIGTNNTANGAVLGSGNYAGNIAINGGGLLYISTNANQTLSGDISGDGALMKSYSGTLTLSGNNTYTGRTSIAPASTAGAGTLVVSSLNSVNGGTPLLANSSLGAPTTVANGTIDLGGPQNIQGGAILRYIGSGETTDRVVNVQLGANTSRTIDASGSGPLKFTSAFTSVGGTFVTTTLQLIGTGDGEITQGLPFAFASLTKNGTGTWTLGGAVENSGTTTITAGTLILNGSKPGAGAVAVNGTSTLGGSGSINGAVTVAAGANLTPGTSVGTLTFTDALNIAAMAGGAGVINLELGPIAASDKIVVGGTLTIGGGALGFSDFVFTALGGLEDGTYKLITSANPVSGSLDDANLSGTIGVSGTGTLRISDGGTGNDIELVVTDVGGGPGPVDHFVISAIASPQTVGTPITGITITAQDAANQTATSFTATVTFGGTGGFSGTSANFVAGELTGVSVTPTVAGTNLTLTVTDGAVPTPHTGSQTIATIQTLYQAWAGGAAFDDDANGDGIDNGVAFLLGAASATSAVTRPGVTQSGGNLVMEFDCLAGPARGGAVLTAQYSSSLASWAGTEVPGTTGTFTDGVVDFEVTDPDPPGGLLHVVATTPVGQASAGKLFGRLTGTP